MGPPGTRSPSSSRRMSSRTFALTSSGSAQYSAPVAPTFWPESKRLEEGIEGRKSVTPALLCRLNVLKPGSRKQIPQMVRIAEGEVAGRRAGPGRHVLPIAALTRVTNERSGVVLTETAAVPPTRSTR